MDHESWPRNPNYEDNNILKSIFLAHSETGKDPYTLNPKGKP